MEEKSQDYLTEELVTTTNNLADIIGWLQKGYYIIIHSHRMRCFHRCNHIDDIQSYINNTRFIYVDVDRMQGLLDDGEWEWYIKREGFNECTCVMYNIVLQPSNVKYKDMFGI